MNRKTAIVIAILAALVAGVIGGYLYRRHTAPTLEERMRDAQEDIQKAFKKMTR